MRGEVSLIWRCFLSRRAGVTMAIEIGFGSRTKFLVANLKVTIEHAILKYEFTRQFEFYCFSLPLLFCRQAVLIGSVVISVSFEVPMYTCSVVKLEVVM